MSAAKSKGVAYDPRVDAYVNGAAAFAKPILEHLRAAVHAAVPGVTEEMKWSRPFFVLDGQIFCNMSAFKEHCSFGFWSTAMTETLAADGIDGVGSSGSLGRIASLEDLPGKKKLDGYLKAAATMVAEGTYGPGLTAAKEGRTVKAAVVVPDDVAAALAKNEAARANFEAFPPSCRREYIDWIAGAKKAETRERRIESAVVKIATGARMNDKYR